MNVSDWIALVAVIVVIGGLFVVPRLRLVGADQAAILLQQGAKVIDVRTPSEFQAQRLPNVLNLPLDELETRIAREVPAKDTALLLHCRSGARSGVALRTLKQLGYTRVFNLGSFARAESILKAAGPPR